MKIVTEGTVLTANLTGEIDHHSAAFMRNSIDSAFIKTTPKELVLNFSDVTFMDSSGVGLVLGRYKQTKQKKCKLILEGLSARDKRMMQMSGIQKMELIEFR